MKKIMLSLLVLSLIFSTNVNAQTIKLDLGFISDITSVNLGVISVGDEIQLDLKVLAPIIIVDPDISVTMVNPGGQLNMNATVTPNEFDPTGTISDIKIELTAEQEGTLEDTYFEIKAYGAIYRIGTLATITRN